MHNCKLPYFVRHSPCWRPNRVQFSSMPMYPRIKPPRKTFGFVRSAFSTSVKTPPTSWYESKKKSKRCARGTSSGWSAGVVRRLVSLRSQLMNRRS